jgi:hypothetical protein
MCRWNYDCSSFAVIYVFAFTPSAQKKRKIYVDMTG